MGKCLRFCIFYVYQKRVFISINMIHGPFQILEHICMVKDMNSAATEMLALIISLLAIIVIFLSESIPGFSSLSDETLN